MIWIQPISNGTPGPADTCESEQEAVSRGCDLIHLALADEVNILEGETLATARISSTLKEQAEP